MLKINQNVSKDAQTRTLLKELLKVHQVHQAYNVRDLTKKIKFADKKWDSLFNFLMAEQIAFARVLASGDDNLNGYVQAKNQAQQAYALAETAINNLENEK